MRYAAPLSVLLASRNPALLSSLLTLSISYVFPPDFPLSCCLLVDLGEEYSDSFFFDRAAATSVMYSVWYVYTERFMNIAS